MRTHLAIAAIITTLAGTAAPALADQVSVGFKVRRERPYLQTGYTDSRFSGGGYQPVVRHDRCPAPGAIRELRRDQQTYVQRETARLRVKQDRRTAVQRAHLERKIRTRHVSYFEAQRARAVLNRELELKDRREMAALDRHFDQKFQEQMASLFRRCNDGRRDGFAGRFSFGDNFVSSGDRAFYY